MKFEAIHFGDSTKSMGGDGFAQQSRKPRKRLCQYGVSEQLHRG
jgi:hypothetical protein